jgi:precorrin-2 methylase
MLCGIVVGIGGGTATLLTVRAKRKRRKISTLTNKKIAKVEKTKSKQDVVNDISNKYKNDEIEK